jgi:hypothetical protein
MAYETKDNTGSLFRNGRKEKETHPDYNGSVRIDGTDMWISGWLRETKDGQKYFSLAFKRKDGTAERPEQKAQEFKDEAKRVFDLDGDSVPF